MVLILVLTMAFIGPYDHRRHHAHRRQTAGLQERPARSAAGSFAMGSASTSTLNHPKLPGRPRPVVKNVAGTYDSVFC